MNLITFLGVASYQETTYTWQNQQFTTRFSPAASARFLQASSVTVFLTEEAEQKVFPDFSQALPPDLALRMIPVPLGRNDTELWSLFTAISQAVPPGEEVAFDITHGLRHFPLVGLLAAAFLQSGLGVHLQAVMYGAFDVGRAAGQGLTPMFDLSPMLALLEWTAAAERFTRSGDARLLADLLDQGRKQLAISARGDPHKLEQVGSVGGLASALSNISLSLRLIRPYLAMQQIFGLPEKIDSALPVLQMHPPYQPLGILLDSVKQSYHDLGVENPGSAENAARTLLAERHLVRWYADRELWMQAASLAREWLLSWVMYNLGMRHFTNKADRDRIEQVLGAEAYDYRQAKQSGAGFKSIFLASVPELETVLSLWLGLVEVRNDILHAAKRDRPLPPQDLVKNLRGYLEQLEALPLKVDDEPAVPGG